MSSLCRHYRWRCWRIRRSRCWTTQLRGLHTIRCRRRKRRAWLSTLARRENALVESHIPGQSQRVGMLVPQPVALRARLIPNKRRLYCFRIKSAPLVVWHMHICHASEDAQMQDIWHLARVPNLIRSAPTQRPGRCSIINMCRGLHRTLPEP